LELFTNKELYFVFSGCSPKHELFARFESRCTFLSKNAVESLLATLPLCGAAVVAGKRKNDQIKPSVIGTIN
jgi:hypothetical protein